MDANANNEFIDGQSITGQSSLEQAVLDILSNGLQSDLNLNDHYITNLKTPSSSDTNNAANVAFVLAQTGTISALNLQQINSANPLTSSLDLTNSSQQLLINDASSAKSALNRQTADSRYYQSTTPLQTITQATGNVNVGGHRITNASTDYNVDSDLLTVQTGDAHYYINTTPLQNITPATNDISANGQIIKQLNMQTTPDDSDAVNVGWLNSQLSVLIDSLSLSEISNTTASSTSISASGQKLVSLLAGTASTDAVNLSQTNGLISTALVPYSTTSAMNSAISSAISTNNTSYVDPLVSSTAASCNTTALGYANTAQTNAITHADLGLAKRAILTNQGTSVVAMGTLQDLYCNDSLANRNGNHIYCIPNNPTLSNTLEMSQPVPYDYLYLNFPNVNQSISALLGLPTSVLDMNSHKITSVTDPTSAQDVATKNYVDTASGAVKQLIQYTNTSPYGSRIQCDSISNMSVYFNNASTRTGQLYLNGSDMVLRCNTGRQQILSDTSSISLYGNKTPNSTIPTGQDTNGVYISGQDDSTRNVQSLLNIVGNTAQTVQLNLASGHFASSIGGATYNALTGISSLGFSLCGGVNTYDATYNPTGTDYVLHMYSAANKTAFSKPFSFYFDDYAGYSNSYSVSTLDGLSSGNVLVPRSYVQSKVAGFVSNPLTANLSAGSFKITNLANGTSSNDAVNFSQLPTVQGQEYIYLMCYNSFIPSAGNYFTNASWNSQAFSPTQNTISYTSSNGRINLIAGYTYQIYAQAYSSTSASPFARIGIYNTATNTYLLGGASSTISNEMSMITIQAPDTSSKETSGMICDMLYQCVSNVSINLFMVQITNIATGNNTTDFKYIKWFVKVLPSSLVYQANSIASNNLTWSNPMNTSGQNIVGLPTIVTDPSQAISYNALLAQNYATLSTNLSAFASPNANINMNSTKLTNLTTGSSSGDSCTYGQLTSAVAGFISNPMTTALACATFKITNVGSASADTDVPQWVQVKNWIPSSITGGTSSNNTISFNGNAVKMQKSTNQYAQQFDLSGYSHATYLQEWTKYNSSNTNWIEHMYTDRTNRLSPLQFTATESQAVGSYILDINGSLCTTLAKGGLHIGSSAYYSIFNCPVQYTAISSYQPGSSIVMACTGTNSNFQIGNFDASISASQYCFQSGYSAGYNSSSECAIFYCQVAATQFNVFVPVSQRKYKKNIELFDLDLMDVNYYNYDYDQDICNKEGIIPLQGKQLGFIVDELQEQGHTKYLKPVDDKISVHYTLLEKDLIAFHQKKIRDQQEEIQTLKKALSDQQKQIDLLFQIIQQ